MNPNEIKKPFDLDKEATQVSIDIWESGAENNQKYGAIECKDWVIELAEKYHAAMVTQPAPSGELAEAVAFMETVEDECAIFEMSGQTIVNCSRTDGYMAALDTIKAALSELDALRVAVANVISTANGNFEDDRGEKAYLLSHEAFDAIEALVTKAPPSAETDKRIGRIKCSSCQGLGHNYSGYYDTKRNKCPDCKGAGEYAGDAAL